MLRSSIPEMNEAATFIDLVRWVKIDALLQEESLKESRLQQARQSNTPILLRQSQGFQIYMPSRAGWTWRSIDPSNSEEFAAISFAKTNMSRRDYKKIATPLYYLDTHKTTFSIMDDRELKHFLYCLYNIASAALITR
jgi:hypothetical protein